MAYLDLQDSVVVGAVAPAAIPSLAAVATPSGFSAREWGVIALARRDTVRSLSEPGRLARVLGRVFGGETPSRLADPRLEALRRIAVHAWHSGYALPQGEIDGFVAAGFTEAQIETLVENVTGLRVTGQRPRTGRA